MSFRDPRVEEWEDRLKDVFDQIDHELEESYGDSFDLHPARPERGTTANPQADGLFNVGATFSAGYGTVTGRGYVVRVQMSTLEKVPELIREQIRNEVAERLRQMLPDSFPGKDLRVVREGFVYKITGDLSFD